MLFAFSVFPSYSPPPSSRSPPPPQTLVLILSIIALSFFMRVRDDAARFARRSARYPLQPDRTRPGHPGIYDPNSRRACPLSSQTDNDTRTTFRIACPPENHTPPQNPVLDGPRHQTFAKTHALRPLKSGIYIIVQASCRSGKPHFRSQYCRQIRASVKFITPIRNISSVIFTKWYRKL